MKKVLVLVVFLALVGGTGVAYWRWAAEPAVSFRTAPIKHGDLLVTISATGTVEPEEVVDVGAQVAGKIESFGKDPRGDGRPIDYGSPVEEGTVLARIDDSLYTADVGQAAAQLEQSKANVLRTRADLEQMKAKLHQAENNWKRAQELGPSRALAATDYDNYLAAYETAKATVGVGEATVVQAEKAVLQAEAALERSKTNLGYCIIKSPVKGVIIDRRVNIGQTVVSSLNAPSLFLIAKDLKKMQVWASVNEADIGSIRPEQPVSFTVDAYPGRTFRGEVGKVRLNASMTQNVVTYTVEINTDNSDGKLLPYLTANVQFEVTQRKDVLMVPNAALRWTPTLEQVAPDVRKELANGSHRKPSTAGTAGAAGAAGTRGTAGKSAGKGEDHDPATAPVVHGRVWVRDGEFVRPISVIVGLSDGTNTEIRGEGANEGTEVIVSEAIQSSGDDATNPFTPRFFGTKRQG
jgi:HlyD family secretion protein